MLALEEAKFFLVTTKTCTKVSCLSWAESYLEKQGFLKHKKKVEISIRVKNGKNIFFSRKMGACAREDKHFFVTIKKSAKESSSR